MRNNAVRVAVKPLAHHPKIYRNICVVVHKFCVQLMDKSLASLRINIDLSITPKRTMTWYVGKHHLQTLMFTEFTHTLSHHFLSHLTDYLSYLSTLSTPPITTTTKYI
jgi:hypothetical protein